MQAADTVFIQSVLLVLFVDILVSSKSQGGLTMKTMTINRLDYAPYPNAATPRQQLHKFVDRCIFVASAVGIVAALMFLAVIV